MPPPMQTQSGSKAALITWTVITSILFVVATVLAIFAHVDRKKQLDLYEVQQKKYEKVISESELAGDLKTRLEEAKASKPEYADKRLVSVAVEQRDNLVRLIAGPQTATEVDAERKAAAAIEAAKAPAAGGERLASESLVAAIEGLTSELKARQSTLESTDEARKEIATKLQGIEETFKAQLAAKDKDLAAARAEVTKFQTDATEDRTNKDGQLTALQTKAEEQARAAQDDVNKLQAQQAELTAQVTKLEQVIKGLQAKLRDVRQGVDQITRQADAHVLRSGGNTVYIDLGTGDHVAAGMTFEIFDRIEGIPRPGDPNHDENLPKGKASIEIVRVASGSSECRVIRSTPGMPIVEGDLCVNLVYDKSISYRFMVYGGFDLDRNGQATPQDGDVIKRLVTSWGGKVVDKLDVDTDFLVLGKVPEIPNYTPEELDTPEKQFEVERLKQELAAYEDLLARAVELNIPVLNQNRFLYFVGYYEMSAR